MRMYDLDAMTLYGFAPDPVMPTAGAARPTEHMAITGTDLAAGWRALIDPRNPLLWFGALLAVTLGAAGISGTAKAGPITASASVGDPT